MIFRLETRLAPLAALFLALACVTACKDKSTNTPAHDELTVAAASDLTPAFEEIGRAFEAVARFFAVLVAARRVAVCAADRLKPFVTALIS